MTPYRPQERQPEVERIPDIFGTNSFRSLFDDLFSRFSPDFNDENVTTGDQDGIVSVNRATYKKSVICVQGECEIETCVNGKCEKKKGAMNID